MTFDEFNKWCEDESLSGNVSIASALGVSAQTVRNWKQQERVPHWVRFACIAIKTGTEPMTITVQSIKTWQHRNGLKTYEDTGSIFHLKRQAVHQWFRRGKFPAWLGLATRGYEIEKEANSVDLNE